MIKQFLILFVFITTCNSFAQDDSKLLAHFQAYYKQMKEQGDVQGVINGLTHLNILSPSIQRKDTLAYLYMSEGQYMQALNTIGYDQLLDDSDIALEVKAVSLKAINQPKLAVGHFEIMFKRSPSVLIAYELSELYIQNQQIDNATKYIEYGLKNSKEDQKKTFYEQQLPYEVPLKSAFMYLKALAVFNNDRTQNLDGALAVLNAVLDKTPNFQLAKISKEELLRQKELNKKEKPKEE